MFGFRGARPTGHTAGETGKIGRNWGVLRKRRDVDPEDWIVVPRPLLPEDVSDLGQALPAMQRPNAATLIYPPALKKADTVAGRRGRRSKTVITTDVDGDTQVWSSWLQSLQHELWHSCEAERTELLALMTALDAEIITADAALAQCPAVIAAARQGMDTAGQITVDASPLSEAEAVDADHIRLDRRRRGRDHQIAQARAAADAAEKQQIDLVARIRELLDRRRYVWQVLLCRVSFLVEHYNRRANVYLTASRLSVRSDVPLLDVPVWAHIEALVPAPVLVNMETVEEGDAA